MKSLFLSLLLLLSAATTSQACLNVYYSLDHNGHLHDNAEQLKRAFNTNFNLSLIERKLQKLEKRLAKEQDYKLLSNYAVLMLKAGKTKEALAILEQLYLHHPEEYQLAANLGTAYELNGDLTKALFYIKRGIELNPEAHQGSEWVHVKILETKLQLQKDPNYLTTHSVLELTEEQKNDPLVGEQIHIQVHERFPFSPPFNAIMANLLIDLGDCYANTTSIEFAKALYSIAKFHHGSKDKRIDEQLRKMLQLRKKYAEVHPKQEGKGDHIKIGGIRYKSLLDDNNKTRHQINWEAILTNDTLLLTAVNLAHISLLVPDINSSEANKKSNNPLTINKEDHNNNLLYGASLFLLALGGFFIIKKRKR
ncbi:MAG: tetratricopeptide repeat protein [Aureispira sp.]